MQNVYRFFQRNLFVVIIFFFFSSKIGFQSEVLGKIILLNQKKTFTELIRYFWKGKQDQKVLNCKQDQAPLNTI